MTLPKTRDAFAFRTFDHNKILQRPLFKFVEVDGEYFLKNNLRGDGEIFESLSPTDDVNQNENFLKKLQVIDESLVRLQWDIIDHRHIPRLIRFKRTTQNPKLKKRAGELYEKYDEIAMTVKMAQSMIEDKIFKLEKIIETQHRKIFAQRLKQARKEKKISQRDLSDLTKINRADIGLYETGKKFPSLDNFIKILRCTGISADWLLGMERI